MGLIVTLKESKWGGGERETETEREIAEADDPGKKINERTSWHLRSAHIENGPIGQAIMPYRYSNDDDYYY